MKTVKTISQRISINENRIHPGAVIPEFSTFSRQMQQNTSWIMDGDPDICAEEFCLSSLSSSALSSQPWRYSFRYLNTDMASSQHQTAVDISGFTVLRPYWPWLQHTGLVSSFKRSKVHHGDWCYKGIGLLRTALCWITSPSFNRYKCSLAFRIDILLSLPLWPAVCCINLPSPFPLAYFHLGWLKSRLEQFLCSF